jgi:pentatricopeptide repeat protein
VGGGRRDARVAAEPGGGLLQRHWWWACRVGTGREQPSGRRPSRRWNPCRARCVCRGEGGQRSSEAEAGGKRKGRRGGAAVPRAARRPCPKPSPWPSPPPPPPAPAPGPLRRDAHLQRRHGRLQRRRALRRVPRGVPRDGGGGARAVDGVVQRCHGGALRVGGAPTGGGGRTSASRGMGRAPAAAASASGRLRRLQFPRHAPPTLHPTAAPPRRPCPSHQRLGDVEAAAAMLQEMVARGCERTPATFMALLRGAEAGGRWRVALDALDSMRAAGLALTPQAYSAAVGACAAGVCVWGGGGRSRAAPLSCAAACCCQRPLPAHRRAARPLAPPAAGQLALARDLTEQLQGPRGCGRSAMAAPAHMLVAMHERSCDWGAAYAVVDDFAAAGIQPDGLTLGALMQGLWTCGSAAGCLLALRAFEEACRVGVFKCAVGAGGGAAPAGRALGHEEAGCFTQRRYSHPGQLARARHRTCLLPFPFLTSPPRPRPAPRQAVCLRRRGRRACRVLAAHLRRRHGRRRAVAAVSGDGDARRAVRGARARGLRIGACPSCMQGPSFPRAGGRCTGAPLLWRPRPPSPARRRRLPYTAPLPALAHPQGRPRPAAAPRADPRRPRL